MAYLRPTSAGISDSWRGHKNRKPPSQEPGTDYACAYGTILVAPANGRIVAVQTSTAGATGRFLTIDLDDGRRIRWLHLSTILVGNGARVSRGQSIARSGASAWGSEWGVGAHVHVSLFPSHSYGGFGPNSTLDFEKHIEEDDVSAKDVWEYPVYRGGKNIRTIDDLVEARSATTRIEEELKPVVRNGKKVPIRQELADAKTNTINILAEVKALTAAVQALALSQGADPAAILAAVQDGVKDAMKGISFTADVD